MSAANPEPNGGPMLLDLKRAAQETGLTVYQLRMAVYRREIPVFRAGLKIHFRPADLKRWIDGRTRML